mgnify:CR=1 FL=1
MRRLPALNSVVISHDGLRTSPLPKELNDPAAFLHPLRARRWRELSAAAAVNNAARPPTQYPTPEVRLHQLRLNPACQRQTWQVEAVTLQRSLRMFAGALNTASSADLVPAVGRRVAPTQAAPSAPSNRFETAERRSLISQLPVVRCDSQRKRGYFIAATLQAGREDRSRRGDELC